MVNTKTQEPALLNEAPADDSLASRKDRLLKAIIRHHTERLLCTHPHLNREIIVGLVGQRGDGKSGSGAVHALIDYLIDGKPVWSNMPIKASVRVGDMYAKHYGLASGGVVTFQTEELDRQALLRLDPDYKNGCYYLDEVNIEFAESRRSMSTTNLQIDKVAQQCRKYNNSVIYTVIDEMFVDSRLRDLTDIFIKCEETALSQAELARRKEAGLDFKLNIYPMTGYMVGRERSYPVTKRHLPPCYLHFKPFRGIYDDKLVQARDQIKYGVKIYDSGKGTLNAIEGIEIGKDSPSRAEEKRIAGMVESVANLLYADGRQVIPVGEVYEVPAVKALGFGKSKLSELLDIHCQIPSKKKYMYGKMRQCYILQEAEGVRLK